MLLSSRNRPTDALDPFHALAMATKGRKGYILRGRAGAQYYWKPFTFQDIIPDLELNQVDGLVTEGKMFLEAYLVESEILLIIC